MFVLGLVGRKRVKTSVIYELILYRQVSVNEADSFKLSILAISQFT